MCAIYDDGVSPRHLLLAVRIAFFLLVLLMLRWTMIIRHTVNDFGIGIVASNKIEVFFFVVVVGRKYHRRCLFDYRTAPFALYSY